MEHLELLVDNFVRFMLFSLVIKDFGKNIAEVGESFPENCSRRTFQTRECCLWPPAHIKKVPAKFLRIHKTQANPLEKN